jgi:hypothetical protein
LIFPDLNVFPLREIVYRFCDVFARIDCNILNIFYFFTYKKSDVPARKNAGVYKKSDFCRLPGQPGMGVSEKRDGMLSAESGA